LAPAKIVRTHRLTLAQGTIARLSRE